jgi:hypothetical protein
MDKLDTLPKSFFEKLKVKLKRNPRFAKKSLKVPDGSRNSALASIAGSMRKFGLSEEAINEQIQYFNLNHCSPVLSKQEVERIAKSISNYEPIDALEYDKKERCKVYSIKEFIECDEFKKPEELVEALFHLGELIICSAVAKAGKSILALHLAICAASGQPFLFKFKTRKSKVLYLQTEIGNYQMKLRLEAATNNQFDQIEDNLFIASYRLKLDKKAGLDLLEKMIVEVGVEVVILDPFYTLHNSSEDSSSEMAPILTNLRALAHKYNVFILLIHHQGKFKEGTSSQTGHKHRGSSSFADVPDGSLSLKRTSPEEAVLSCEMRNVKDPGDIKLVLDGMQWHYRNEASARPLNSTIVGEVLEREGEMIYSDLIDEIMEEYAISKRMAQKFISQALKRNSVEKRKEGRKSYYSVVDFPAEFYQSIGAKNICLNNNENTPKEKSHEE